MRRPNSALSAVIVALGLSAPVVHAQRFVNAPAPTPDKIQAQAASSYDPMMASRGARPALRNGLDYLNYKEYARALRYLRAAESRQNELEPADLKLLKAGIEQAQRGLRETNNPAGIATRDRNRTAGAITPARSGIERSPDGIELTATTKVENVPTSPVSSSIPTIDVPMPPSAKEATPAPTLVAPMPPVSLDPAPALIENAPASLPVPAPASNVPSAPPESLPEPPAVLPSTPTATLEKPVASSNELPIPQPHSIPTSTEAKTSTPSPAVKAEAPGVLTLEPLPDTPPTAASSEPKGPTSAPAPEVHTTADSKQVAPTELPPLGSSATEAPKAAESTPAKNIDSAVAPTSETQTKVGLNPSSPVDAKESTPAPTPLPPSAPTELPPLNESKPSSAPEANAPETTPTELPKAVTPAPAAEPKPVESMPAEPAKAPNAPTSGLETLPPLPDQPLPTGKPDLNPSAPVAVPAPEQPSASAVPVATEARAETPTPPPAPAAEELPTLPVRRVTTPAPLLSSPAQPKPANPSTMRRFRPETEEAIARIAQRQTEEAQSRAGQPSNLPKPLTIIGGATPPSGDDPSPDAFTGTTNASTRFELSRAPSPTEAWPIRRIPIPEEFVPIQPRNWEPARKYWQAPAFCHMPLYFQDASLERYGHSIEQFFGPTGRFLSYPIDDPSQSKMRMQLVQPFWSIGLFAFQIGTLPYKLIVDPPWEAEYDLGYYRPGDRIPTDTFYLPLHGVGPVLPPINGRKW